MIVQGEHVEMEATEARQGRWGRHMLWVLLVSLVLVFAALMGTWAVRSGDLERADTASSVTVQEMPPSG